MNKDAILNYMSIYPVKLIRSNIIIFFIIFIGLFVGIPVIGDPFVIGYMYVLSLPLIVFSLWGLLIFINPIKRQIQFVLFVGVFGILQSIALLIVIHKFIYYMMAITNPIFYATLLSLYGIIAIYYVRFHVRAVHRGYYLNKAKENVPPIKRKGSILAIGSTFGLFAGNILIGLSTDQVMEGFMVFVYFVTSIVFIMVATNVYKYYCIKKYAYLLDE